MAIRVQSRPGSLALATAGAITAILSCQLAPAVAQDVFITTSAATGSRIFHNIGGNNIGCLEPETDGTYDPPWNDRGNVRAEVEDNYTAFHVDFPGVLTAGGTQLRNVQSVQDCAEIALYLGGGGFAVWDGNPHFCKPASPAWADYTSATVADVTFTNPENGGIYRRACNAANYAAYSLDTSTRAPTAAPTPAGLTVYVHTGIGSGIFRNVGTDSVPFPCLDPEINGAYDAPWNSRPNVRAEVNRATFQAEFPGVVSAGGVQLRHVQSVQQCAEIALYLGGGGFAFWDGGSPHFCRPASPAWADYTSATVAAVPLTDPGNGIVWRRTVCSGFTNYLAYSLDTSTRAPTAAPTATVSPTTSDPTANPTTPEPTDAPTEVPSVTPTLLPSTPIPTKIPTESPTPTAPSTSNPTGIPTEVPSVTPTLLPSTSIPTKIPTESPTTTAPTTSNPTGIPTGVPSVTPTLLPSTSIPTEIPTEFPTTTVPTTSNPTGVPTEVPSVTPTLLPSTSIPTDSSPQSSNGGEEDNGSGDGENLTTIVGGAAMGAVILVMVIVIMRQRAQQQPQPATQQVFPPVNNPAFEPEYATMNYDVVGNVMPPQAPQYDTVGFMRDQKYAVLGPHSTYSSVETNA